MLAAAVLLLPLPASGGLIWNLGAALGYASLAFAVVLYLYPLRGEGIAHRRLFTASQHRRLGWIALILAGLHTAILLFAQPLTGHYLLPSAPLYMLCGLAALIALAVLVATGISARSALRQPAAPRKSSASVATHAVLAGAAARTAGGAHRRQRPAARSSRQECDVLRLARARTALVGVASAVEAISGPVVLHRDPVRHRARGAAALADPHRRPARDADRNHAHPAACIFST